MPKIPRALDLAGPAQQTRGVVDVPVVEASTAGAHALAQAGKVLQDFSDTLYKADVDRKVTEADRKTREDLDREYRALETSGDIDPTEFEGRFKEASDKVIAKNAEIVPHGGRALWTERAKTQWQSDGILKSRGLTRTRQLEAAKAGMIEDNAALVKQAGDRAVQEETFVGNVQAQRNLIDRQVTAGILPQDDGAVLMAQLDELIVTDKTARVSANVDELVQTGRIAEAKAQFMANYKEIDPKQRDVIEHGLRTAELDAKAIEQGDDIWTRAGRDYSKALPMLEKIENPVEREKAEKRVATLKTMDEAADREKKEAAQQQLWDHMLKGGKVANASPAVLGATEGDIGFARAYEEARDRQATLSDGEKAKWADWSLDAKQKLDTMPTEQFLKPIEQWPQQAKALYDGMDPDRQRAVRQKQIDMKEKGQTQDSAMATYRDLVSRAKSLVPKDWKLSTETVMGEKDGLEFSGQLYALAKRYATDSGGKAIPEKEAREIVARALNAYRPYTPGMFGGGSGFGLPPDLLAKDMVARLGPNFDVDVAMKVKDALTVKLKREPTSQELLTAYNQVQAQ